MNTASGFIIDYLKKYESSKEIFYTKKDNKYIPFNYEELFSSVTSLIKYFAENGIIEGDKAAIISENRIEWAVTDIACIFKKIVTVPVYPSITPEQIKYILNNAEVKVCFVSGKHILDKILSIRNDVPTLTKIITFNDIPSENAETLDSILRKECYSIEEFEKLNEEIQPDDDLTYIYTSGTTGEPKGVILTHKSISANISGCMKVLKINDKDIFLSFLPYSHSYERTAGYYLALFSGAKIYFAESIDSISVQLPEVKPTILICVPRLLERVYNKLLRTSIDMPEGFKKKIFNRGLNAALNKTYTKDSWKWKIADKLVYSKIRGKTGGRVRFFASGGGALNKKIGEFFDYIGMTVLEGYGLSEFSPVISVNHLEKNKYGTVGLPLSGVTVKIAEDGEIIVKGDSIMKGYYKLPGETETAIRDGWLFTGDIGTIDSDGFIQITDRKKSLFKTSGGKYIAPTHIEALISQLPYVDQIIVIGNNRMFVAALLYPDTTALRNAYKDISGVELPLKDITDNKEILKMVEKDLLKIQKDLAQFERVRKFRLLKEPFTIENGEMTPTMKLKRKVIEEKFSDIIEGMYQL
ncbi:AMP-dependent synthetase/ligase [soil metagenome]